MELKIHSNSHINDVKSNFSNAFKGLKIEFFSKSHNRLEGSPKDDMVSENVHLSELNPSLVDKEIHVSAAMKVSELESTFEKDFGLHIQVFRKMGRSWIETTRTDSYSLKEQMDLSADSLKSFS